MSTQTIQMPIAAESSPPSAAPSDATGPLRSASIPALLPGVALLFAIGLLGKLLQQILPVHIEYVLWAIILGLAVSNFAGVAAIFRPGIATYELWLKLGIVLVGARFLLKDIVHVGGLFSNT